MKTHFGNIDRKKFVLNIVVPTLLTITLFLVLLFWFIVPYFEVNMMNGKKEMIREIVNTSIFLADKYHQEEQTGLLSSADARNLAKSRIENLRYGIDEKDYLWITDTVPVMIMHPYRDDLNGQNLSGFRDPSGKKLFADIVIVVKESGHGYVDYMWQWMDDSTRIVPKISYVREFTPWGWIIGTGVYIEDVRNEITGIKKILIVVSLCISLVMAFLLTIIVRRNLRVEIQRSTAEAFLKESREKYKALVEASSDGSLMFLDGHCIYANNKIKEILPEGRTENLDEDLHEIIHPESKADIRLVRDFMQNDVPSMQFETTIITRNNTTFEALISLSKVQVLEKKGSIVIIKDLRAISDEAELSAGLETVIQKISDMKAIGVFKALPSKKGKFIYANTALVEMLGFASKEDLLKTTILDLIGNAFERKELFRYLAHHTELLGYPLNIQRKDGSTLSLLIYAVAQVNESKIIDQLSGIIVNVSSFLRQIKAKDDHLQSLLASRNIYFGTVHSLVKSPHSCLENVSLLSALDVMNFHQTDLLFVKTGSGKIAGALSEMDIVKSLQVKDFSVTAPVRDIMNTSLVFCSPQTTISDAMREMQIHNISYLVVRQNDEDVIGILRKDDLLRLLSADLEMNYSDIQRTVSMEQIKSHHDTVPTYVQSLLGSGANISTVTHAVTQCSDDITQKLISMVIHETGIPPAPFAFIVLGSEGRKEQTLITDQDNGIIYSDTGSSGVDAAKYFQLFGARMNELLHKAGYELCKGNVMAGNPKWNKPLKVWEGYFAGWISEANPKNIVDISTFFDYRIVYGDREITNALRVTINTLLGQHPAFFVQMAIECANYKIPLGIFGKLQTEVTEDNTGVINIKNVSRILVHIIRLYSMKHHIDETNTLLRLIRLQEVKAIPHALSLDMLFAHKFLLDIQFRYQSYALSKNISLDHDINLSFLSDIEISTLKSVLSAISTFQNKLKHDFSVPG